MNSEGTVIDPVKRSPFERVCSQCGTDIPKTAFAPRVQRRVTVTVAGGRMKGERIDDLDFCNHECLARWRELEYEQ